MHGVLPRRLFDGETVGSVRGGKNGWRRLGLLCLSETIGATDDQNQRSSEHDGEDSRSQKWRQYSPNQVSGLLRDIAPHLFSSTFEAWFAPMLAHTGLRPEFSSYCMRSN
jgi:hypothetical protein